MWTTCSPGQKERLLFLDHKKGPLRKWLPNLIKISGLTLRLSKGIWVKKLTMYLVQLAGGLGGGILAFLSAELKRGVEIVIEATGLSQIVADADLVITGEGKIDGQTIFGKTPIGVAKTAKKYGVPVIGIAGNVSRDSCVVHEHGIDAVFSIAPGVVLLENVFKHAEE